MGFPLTLLGAHPLGLLLVGCMPGVQYCLHLCYGEKVFKKNIFGLADVIRFDLPVTSYITGYEFNRGIWKVLDLLKLRIFGSSIFVTRQTSQTPRWISTKKDMRGGSSVRQCRLQVFYPYRI